MASLMEELSFLFYSGLTFNLNLNSHIWLVAFVLDGTGLKLRCREFRVLKIRLDNSENNEFDKVKAHCHLLQINIPNILHFNINKF